MRNYLYISDAKVGAYLPQIRAPEKRRIAARLGFNVAVLQGSVETESISVEDRVNRLEAVEAKIRAVKHVGTLDATAPWIDGTVDAVAATFRGDDEVMFFFATDGNDFLGLAGASHHLIGNVRPTTAFASPSHLGSLLRTLKAVTSNYAFVVEKSDASLAHFLHSGVRQTDGVSSWTKIMNLISQQFADEPTQTISFLARRLTSDAYGPHGKRYTLATPLYVTLDDLV